MFNVNYYSINTSKKTGEMHSKSFTLTDMRQRLEGQKIMNGRGEIQIPLTVTRTRSKTQHHEKKKKRLRVSFFLL